MALIDTHKAVKQFTTAGIPEKQAEAITEVISNIDQQVATKSDIARLEDKIEIEAKWIKALLLLLLAVGIKIAFFNS
ncbi:MAG: hypothetical protein GY777_04510 [Candidatus Brocadiaceae bacterium]|nr:hypothetical protein [Candidatus Brocadiaceae bacterium]